MLFEKLQNELENLKLVEGQNIEENEEARHAFTTMMLNISTLSTEILRRELLRQEGFDIDKL